MAIKCPSCGSDRIEALNYGERTGAVVGGAAGAYSAYTTTKISELAVAGFLRLLPYGNFFSNAASSSSAGPENIFLGALAGGTAGAKVGEFADKKILNNRKCLSCGHTFQYDKCSST